MARGRNSSGMLRHRIVVQVLTSTDDDTGGVTTTWATHVSAWASVQPMSARESFARGAVAGTVMYRVRMRYQAGVTPAMRVSHASRYLRIEGVRNVDEESRWLELDCTEEPV